MKAEEQEKKQTPIVDGDARPDVPTHPEKTGKSKKPPRSNAAGEGKFTTERGSDINSLEDYKDSK